MFPYTPFPRCLPLVFSISHSPSAPFKYLLIYIPNQYLQVLHKSSKVGQGTARAMAGSEMWALISQPVRWAEQSEKMHDQVDGATFTPGEHEVWGVPPPPVTFLTSIFPELVGILCFGDLFSSTEFDKTKSLKSYWSEGGKGWERRGWEQQSAFLQEIRPNALIKKETR